MFKTVLIRTLGALGIAMAAMIATVPMIQTAKAEWTCDNCDCKCGRCHSITRGVYCCPCKKSNSGSENSSRSKFKAKPKTLQLSPSQRALRRR